MLGFKRCEKVLCLSQKTFLNSGQGKFFPLIANKKRGDNCTVSTTFTVFAICLALELKQHLKNILLRSIHKSMNSQLKVNDNN